MHILSTKQIRELDAYTIKNEPVASLDLMERASRAFVDWFVLKADATKKVAIVCGTGNNGGDGLAIARMLYEWSYPVSVWIVAGGTAESEDFKANLARLPEKVERRQVSGEQDAFPIEGFDIIIDAVFGSGLSRPPAGVYAYVIEVMNQAEAMRIAVDIPSGLMADAHSPGPVVRAHYTVSFQLPKLAFLLPEAFPFTGEWVLVDIGLDKSFIRNTDTPYFFLKPANIKRVLRPRSKFDHKGTFGHALLIAGGYGKMGAAVLAARACLRTGVGLLSVHVPERGYTVMQIAVPEAMCRVDDDQAMFTAPPDLTSYSALGIGPGLGQDDRTKAALSRTLDQFGKPVVLDADALNMLGSDRTLMKDIPPGSILTPHPKEFERLTGRWKDDFERLEMQKQLAASLKAIVILKGAYTSIATDDGRVYFNSTGNPGMATGGAGDVLTGILTALLAQKYTPVEAAISGVFLHGLAGDIAATEYGVEALIASDIVDHLPKAFRKISGK